jgi:hypothetical protein
MPIGKGKQRHEEIGNVTTGDDLRIDAEHKEEEEQAP